MMKHRALSGAVVLSVGLGCGLFAACAGETIPNVDDELIDNIGTVYADATGGGTGGQTGTAGSGGAGRAGRGGTASANAGAAGGGDDGEAGSASAEAGAAGAA